MKNLRPPKKGLNIISFIYIYEIIPTGKKQLVVFCKRGNLIGSLTGIFCTQNLYVHFSINLLVFVALSKLAYSYLYMYFGIFF